MKCIRNDHFKSHIYRITMYLRLSGAPGSTWLNLCPSRVLLKKGAQAYVQAPIGDLQGEDFAISLGKQYQCTEGLPRVQRAPLKKAWLSPLCTFPSAIYVY